MKVGFTGTSKGMSDRQKTSLRADLINLGTTEFHHGDCVGADAEARQIALDLNIDVIIHPPSNDYKRAYCGGAILILPPKPYLDRNHDIVDAVDMMFAAPRGNTEERRSGTWATWRYAKKVGRSITLVNR